MANVTEYDVSEIVAVLAPYSRSVRFAAVRHTLTLVHSNEGKDTRSPFEIVGHLVFAERTDWIPRVRILLEHGETHPFEPFDRFAQFKANQEKSLEELLDDFGCLRRDNLTALHALELKPEDLSR